RAGLRDARPGVGEHDRDRGRPPARRWGDPVRHVAMGCVRPRPATLDAHGTRPRTAQTPATKEQWNGDAAADPSGGNDEGVLYGRGGDACAVGDPPGGEAGRVRLDRGAVGLWEDDAAFDPGAVGYAEFGHVCAGRP